MKYKLSLSWFLMSLVAVSFSACFFTNPSPEPCFSYAVNEGTVTFNSSCSENANTFQWDFGDGESSLQQNPVHTFAASGTYTVTLLVTSKKGKTETFTELITVTIPVSVTLPLGTFALNETCTSGQAGPYSVTFSSVSGQPLKANVSGLWESSQIVVADFAADGLSFTIASQEIITNCNLSSTSGTVSNNGNTINLTYSVSCPSSSDNCVATLTK